MKKHMDRKNLDRFKALIGALVVIAGPATSQAADAPAPVPQDDGSEALFEQGMEALEDDRLKSAMKAFQSILSQQPALHRARLELAVAYYRSLQYAEARKLAQEVLDDPHTPPEVRVTVLAFLAQIQSDEAAAAVRHEFKPSISMGMMYDSNVNVGASSEIIEELPGSVLQPDSLEQSDNALLLSAGLAHTFQPGKIYDIGERTAALLWQSQATLYERAYNDLQDFDLTVLSAGTGPALVMLRHWRATLPLTVDRIWLGGSELAWYTSLSPAVTWQFNNGELTWDATVTNRDYDDNRSTFDGGDGGHEGIYKATGVAAGRYFQQRKVAAQVGARVLDFNADEAAYGYDGYELLAGVVVKTWPGGSVYGRANYRDVQYDGPEASGKARDEQERRLGVGFQHDFQAGRLEKWTLIGALQYTDNDSNVSYYNFDRQQVVFNLGRTF